MGIVTPCGRGEQFPLWYNLTLAGAGDLRSTVHDILTYLAANVGLINSRLYDAMQVTQEPRYPIDSTMKIGLDLLRSATTQTTAPTSTPSPLP